MADPTTVNPNLGFMTGTDPAAINSLYAPVTNPQTPTTAPVANPAPAGPATPTASQSTTQAPAAQTAAAPTSVVDLLNNLGQDSSYTGRAQLAQQLGIQHYTGSASQNTQLASKYQNYFNTVKGSQAPTSNPSSDIQTAVAPAVSSDPTFNSYASMMSPIMKSLTQVLQDINNPAITGANLQTEYDTLSKQSKLPELQTQMLNMQNIMNGTTDDIRDEITKAGGFATESQVQAMTASRNNVILKQYNAVASQYQAAQTNISNMMQYATSDKQTALAKEQATAGIIENMASIGAQMQQMGMTMQQHATDNANKIVTNVGYQGLAASANGNPQMLNYYENMLGLTQGSLSNPTSLSKLETYRQQTIAQGAQKVQIQMYNAGLSTGGTPNALPGNYATPPGQSPVLVATKSSGNDTQGRPYSVSGTQAQNLLKGGATIDPGTNNIVVPGIGYYIAQPGGSYALSIDPKSAEGQFIQYRNRAENPAPWQPSGSLSNQRMTRNSLTRQVNAALTQYVDSPLYQNVASAATYFAKLNAGLKNPGSIGDPDIIDSLVKINTGGQGAITEQQYSAYAQGQTWSDKFQVVGGKVTAKGGTLSPDQRTQINKLANDTFANYQSEYETMYVQGMKNLDNQGIPDAFWGNMPDWSGLIGGASFTPLPDETPTN